MILKKTFTISLLAFFFIIVTEAYSQEVPHPVTNRGIYEYLDELATLQVITLNSTIKPYTRLYIARKLREAESSKDKLNRRQLAELDFYLMDFGKELNIGKDWTRRKDLFYYSDSLFSLTINPILGGEMFANNSGKATYWRNGAEVRGYIKNWAFYASLRDNHEKPFLGRPEYLTQREGGHIKGSTDWSEMQGGITYSWDWGNIGLIKDRQQWGSNYNGANIFGGNNPTYVQLRLQVSPVKWFTFNYFHGWLNSMVVDSADSYWVDNSYGRDFREVYHKKYLAANIFTFTPLKNLNISAGNSIMYSDEKFSPSYIIPVFFYKSVDHSQTSGVDNMNSQMYFDVSSRQVKKLHLYATLFVDELSIDRFGQDDEWNFLSWKAGFRVTDLPVSNLSFTAEFTYTYPLAFQHYVPTLTFETASFNMGHYLKDNSKEWYMALDYKPFRTLNVNLYFLDAVRGPDYSELGGSRVGNPPLATIEWHNTTVGCRANFQLVNDVYIWLSAFHNNIRGDRRWSPGYFFGSRNNLNIGATVGF